MKLQCDTCGRVYTDAPEEAVGLRCDGGYDDEDDHCNDGILLAKLRIIKMVGDPETFKGGFARKEAIYRHMMTQKYEAEQVKKGLVPQSLRRGLWYHLP